MKKCKSIQNCQDWPGVVAAPYTTMWMKSGGGCLNFNHKKRGDKRRPSSAEHLLCAVWKSVCVVGASYLSLCGPLNMTSCHLGSQTQGGGGGGGSGSRSSSFWPRGRHRQWRREKTYTECTTKCVRPWIKNTNHVRLNGNSRCVFLGWDAVKVEEGDTKSCERATGWPLCKLTDYRARCGERGQTIKARKSRKNYILPLKN